VFFKQFTKKITTLPKGMLAGVKKQEDDQTGQAPLAEAEGNSCFLTLRVWNHLNIHLIQCRWFYGVQKKIITLYLVVL
jgi:hypothetical protein